MKILHLSDLHLDVNERATGIYITDILMEHLIEIKDTYDIILISGDLTNSLQNTIDIIEEIEVRTGKKVYFVPGNHDLASYFGNSSEVIYNKFLEHPSNLIGKPLVLENGFAIVSALGWYDYSFGNQDTDEEDFVSAKKLYWYDGTKIHFKDSDPMLCYKSNVQLRKDLLSVQDAKGVWVMSHFVPYNNYISYKDMIWNICNAFMGSTMTGETIDEFNNVKLVSFGHTHYRYGLKERKDGKLILCKPLGYINEWDDIDPLEEIKSVITIIDTDKLMNGYYNK